MTNAIEIKNLYHNFSDKVVCDNISLNFEKNKIYGLLGKNGTGKTTLINIMTNQLMSKQGEIKIFGENPNENPSILEDLCVVREREFYESDAKVKEIFKLYSCFYPNYDHKLEEKLCKRFELDKKKYYKKLSRGMKTMISNIIGICSNAPITIFDEPTIGLDAVNRAEFYNILLDSYVENNRTIIISTHQINEVDEILEKLVIIKDGKVMIDEDADEVRQNSYYITGKIQDLEKLSLLDSSYLYKKFGNTYTYSYFGNISEEDFELITTFDIGIEKMNIQDLFISMNQKEGV